MGERIMAKKKVDFTKDQDIEVNWKEEYGMMMPFCPRCDEPAYEHDHCVFCGQRYHYTPKPKGYEDTIVEYKNYRATQVYGSWGVYIEKDNQEIQHWSCGGKISEDKLLEYLKALADNEVSK